MGYVEDSLNDFRRCLITPISNPIVTHWRDVSDAMNECMAPFRKLLTAVSIELAVTVPRVADSSTVR